MCDCAMCQSEVKGSDMGDTRRVNPDEPKAGPNGEPVADRPPMIYQRDVQPMIEFEITKREDGRVIWINVDGVNYLRVMPSAACHVKLVGFAPEDFVR